MTETKFLEDARSTSDLFLDRVRRADEIWIATAWASDGSPAARALWRRRDRIVALAVGLDFYQTDPEFLRRFRASARVHLSADGTFHPKVYVLRHGKRFDAIVGSSNFTHAGFGKNVEANVHLAGSTGERLFSELTAYVADLAVRGRQMHEWDLEHYEKQWRARRRDARRLAAFTPLAKRGHSRGSADLHVGWDEFVDGMQKAVKGGGDRIGIYLDVIAAVQSLFRRKKRLSRMSRPEAERVAGLADGFGYFGQMRAAGLFARYVQQDPGVLDAALDHIPAKPREVTRADFDAFVREMRKRKGLGSPAVGSRLLAMKRPDVFLCLDGPNRVGLASSFGLTKGRLSTYEGYGELISLLHACPWYKSSPPSGRERKIWDARVALVDAYFYGE